MASKRNSRVYIDEAKRSDENQHRSSTAVSFKSRRNSIMDEKLQYSKDGEDGLRGGTIKEPVSASRSQMAGAVGQESPVLSQCEMTEKTAVPSSTGVPNITRVPDVTMPPVPGRPHNFGLVVPGVYRSSYPKPEDYGFLQNLKLKTVVTLVKRDEVDDDFQSFVSLNGINQVIINMKGTKKEAIPTNTMKSILRLVLNHQNYPLLLHCNHGKHRTGCVVAVIRKLSGWDLHSVLDEYKTYATPKIRECDVDYITAFQPFALPALESETPLQFSPGQLKVFFRALLFSTFVMVLWLVSGSHMPMTPDTVG